jgi:hypothetical protein
MNSLPVASISTQIRRAEFPASNARADVRNPPPNPVSLQQFFDNSV